jgi:mRNA interferase RelE/StbE
MTEKVYTVYIKSGAEKQLKKLVKSYKKIITEEILALGDNPRPHGSRKLTALPDHYRIRVGPYRVIYTIQDEKLVVVVIRIGARKDIYREF